MGAQHPPGSGNLADRFEAVARRVPDREAIVSAEAQLTFGQLDRRANQVAQLLRVKSVGPGDAVGLVVDDGPRRIEALIATLKVRAIPFDLGGRPDPGDAARVLRRAGAGGVFISRTPASHLAETLLRVPSLHFFVVVDDGSQADVLLPNAVFYEEGRRAYQPDQEWPPRSSDDAYGVVRPTPDGLGVETTAQSDLGTALDPTLASLLSADTVVL